MIVYRHGDTSISWEELDEQDEGREGGGRWDTIEASFVTTSPSLDGLTGPKA